MENLINEAKRMQELAGVTNKPTTSTPSDVAALQKTKASATTVQSKEKNINTTTEFTGAFENWFKGLGFQPGKVSKAFVRNTIDKVLTDLGYK